MNHQPPDYTCKYGHSEILQEQLYLGGEDDVDALLYDNKEAFHLNEKGCFMEKPSPKVDVWIDLREDRPTNRLVYVPETVEYVAIPFRDGFLDEARKQLPVAKEVLTERLLQNKKVLVTCHQGRSRSVMLLLWYLAEKEGSFVDAYWKIQRVRPIMEPDKRFSPLLNEWKEKYPKEMSAW